MVFYKKILFDQLTPISIYTKLKEMEKGELSFLFESAINTEDGNYSFVFIGAKERLIHKNGKSVYINEKGEKKEVDENPFLFLKRYYEKIDKDYYRKLSKELNVGFIDGFVGYIGYDLVKVFEPVLKDYMNNLKDELDIPDLELIRPKIVAVFSHKTNTLTLVTSIKNYADRLDEIIDYLKRPSSYIEIKKSEIDLKEGKFAFDKERFFEMVRKSKEMIKSGDVFQIVMSNRFTQFAKIDRLSFYRILRSKNPSPYMYLLEFEDFAIAGSSPEVMVGLKDSHILLRPIAGTRRRGDTWEEDRANEIDMINDEKERAEHLMLVDLGRNDVGKVAKAGSVYVPALMRVERYSHVMHMVSDVEAILDEKYDMFDLFAATFTAGTMTGTPKIRAMELIAEFEGLKRGYYSGSIGYFGFDGNMDTAITIRTSLLKKDRIIFQAGAGIVADSKPELEYLEVKNKLGALMSTLKDLKK